MNSDQLKFSDEAYKVAELALKLWESNPMIKEREGPYPGYVSTWNATRLLSLAESQLNAHSLSTDLKMIEYGRTLFEPLLTQDSQANLPPDETRTLGRITKKSKLIEKIESVFPSKQVFEWIDKLIIRQNFTGDGNHLARMTDLEISEQALKNSKETEKEFLILGQLSNYVLRRRHGFIPTKEKRYPFQNDPKNEEWQLFRASEDICLSGWLSAPEKGILFDACHTSKSPQGKSPQGKS